MRLADLSAEPVSTGNAIRLRWRNPDPGAFPGVRVVRRDSSHPVTPDDGVVVKEQVGLMEVLDDGLSAEVVYYYTLYPFQASPRAYSFDPHNRVAAMAAAPYDMAGLLYRLLPALYQRYDEAQGIALVGSGSPDTPPRGQLRRFLELIGPQLDQLYSFTRAQLGFCDVNRVEGSLLPLLAQWIGWNTDYRLELGAQRNELRFAPAIYQTVGMMPTVEATVKRLTRWESRTKEFVHNVARTNQPERLNLWSMLRASGTTTFSSAALASLNFSYEGRPSAVLEADGSVSLFLHTLRRRGGWDVWTKRWVAGQWQPSMPVAAQVGIDMHPAAALQGSVLWLFWENQDPDAPAAERKWRIAFRTRSGNVWSEPAWFSDATTERRAPGAAVDASGGLWLFWLEWNGTRWVAKYSRHDGTQWLAAPIAFPMDAGNDPGVESDLFAMFHPTNAAAPLWLFWARRQAVGTDGLTRWTIAYRSKATLNPALVDWSPVKTLPKAAALDHDREPLPLAAAGGNIELFWSSTRSGAYGLSSATLGAGTDSWQDARELRDSPYSNRAPAVVQTPQGTLLVFRSNESIEHQSALFGATRSLDHRHAGSTLADTRNAAKLALRGKFEDFQTYTYDAGSAGVRTNEDRIARDTVGLYLTPDTTDPAALSANLSRLASSIGDFLPVTQRAVLITP